MSIFSSIQSVIAQVLKYLPFVVQAVTQVEAAIGAGNGATKKQIAVSAVVAAAHAGETVSNETVQQIAGYVDSTVSVLNALGVLPKPSPVPGQ